MVTIRGSIGFIIEQQRRLTSTHHIKSLTRRNGDWYLTVDLLPSTLRNQAV